VCGVFEWQDKKAPTEKAAIPEKLQAGDSVEFEVVDNGQQKLF